MDMKRMEGAGNGLWRCGTAREGPHFNKIQPFEQNLYGANKKINFCKNDLHRSCFFLEFNASIAV